MTDNKILDKSLGISKEKQQDIIEKLQYNRQLLGSCELHDFSEEVKQPNRLTSKWKCSKCGGIVDYHEKLWYEEGVAHALKQGK